MEQRLLVRSGGESELALTAPARSPGRSGLLAARGLRSPGASRWGPGLVLLGGGLAAQLRSNARYDELNDYCRARAGCLSGEADLTAVHGSTVSPCRA